MTRIKSNDWLLPSVLDRLIDTEPDNTRELPRNRVQLLWELKQSVKRDLESLLNTRVPFVAIPPKSRHLDRSLLNYGMPDLSSTTLDSSVQLEAMRRRVEQVIRDFEPRFQSVRVSFSEDSNRIFSRQIRFIIDGVLHAEPAPEAVRYDSVLLTALNQFQIQSVQ